MKKRMIGCLAIVPVLAMAGENGGVSATNYNAGIGFNHTENSNSASLSIGASFPLHDYVGASLYANGSRYENDDYDFANNFGLSLGGSIFLRDFNLGKIGIGANHSTIYFDTPHSPNQLYFGKREYVDTYGYSLSAQYYLSDFTISASRSVSDSDFYDRGDYASASIGLYWKDNIRLTAGRILMVSNNNYNVGVAFQPEALNNSTQISFSYSDSEGNDYFSLSATYYFDTLVTLKDRDRKY